MTYIKTIHTHRSYIRIKVMYACMSYIHTDDTYRSYIIQAIHTHASHTCTNRSYIHTYIRTGHTYIQLHIKVIHITGN